MEELCPFCGAYWEHDLVECGKEHGVEVVPLGKPSLNDWLGAELRRVYDSNYEELFEKFDATLPNG